MNELQDYIDFFIQNGPFSSRKTLIGTLLVLLILATLLILYKEKWTTKEKCFKTAVWSYLYLIFLYTFLSRSVKKDVNYNLTPFWSYQHIFLTHDFKIVLEVLINCLMFIPVGILVPWAYEKYLYEDRKREQRAVLLFGLIISVSLECLQLFTRTGLFEWDDIIHNMIGLILGYGLYLWLDGKRFWEVHRYFLPMMGVGLALMISML